jgi:hypothetical protein
MTSLSTAETKTTIHTMKLNKQILLSGMLGLAVLALPPSVLAQPTAGTPGSPSAIESKHRSHLPMPNTVRQSYINYDAKSPDTKNPPIEQLRPPKGAPNVLIVLIDDAGFGSSSAFGGPCQTPTLEKLETETKYSVS